MRSRPGCIKTWTGTLGFQTVILLRAFVNHGVEDILYFRDVFLHKPPPSIPNRPVVPPISSLPIPSSKSSPTAYPYGHEAGKKGV